MISRRHVLMMPFVAVAARARAQADPWHALRSGAAIVFLRHALAPGTGDPPGFRLDSCATQRNLSDAGRRQARRIGAHFRANGIDKASVLSSQWCRCLDTAALLDLGPVKPEPRLNSFFGNSGVAARQTDELRQWMENRPSDGPAVLVTHQVNITGLTSIVPSSGELVFVAAADPKMVIARVPVPA